MGAEGETAVQLDRGLSLTMMDMQSVADNYHSILSKYENSKILNIANTVYVMKDRELNGEYEEVLSQKFYSSAENIDFSKTENAVQTINSWASSKTANNIKNLVSSKNFNKNTRLLVLSAIHFNGTWSTGFPKELTMEDDFYLDDNTTVKVQMMRVKSTFLIGNHDGLQATGILLPYKDCDLSMLILVPYATNGLVRLTDKLKYVDLSTTIKNTINMLVKADVRLPKFKGEFKIKLNDALTKVNKYN